MKCIPKEGQPAFYNNLLHIFDKEVTLYKKILPMLTEFTGTDELAKMVPECFGAGLINGDRIMCLRDFSADGFKTTGKKELHSLELIRTALEHLAKFHAPSLAMQALNGSFLLEYSICVIVALIKQH